MRLSTARNTTDPYCFTSLIPRGPVSLLLRTSYCCNPGESATLQTHSLPRHNHQVHSAPQQASFSSAGHYKQAASLFVAACLP